MKRVRKTIQLGGIKEVHTVMMNRWGNDEDHSYIIGVFEKRSKAMEVARKEELYRGGKYKAAIKAFSLDEITNAEGYEEKDELTISVNEAWRIENE